MFWPTCSLVRLTGEYVGLVPGTRHLIPIFHLSEVATGEVLLEKLFLEISQNSQESTYGKVSFLIKLQAEATASDFFRVFSRRFLVYFISTENEMKKGKYPDGNIYYFALASICLTSKIPKKN